jgi:outer membrane immunogenic protein
MRIAPRQKGINMRKLLFALSAFAAFAGPAIAADLPARTYSKAPPPMVPVASWTGCYVGAGGGYGMWNQDNTSYLDVVPRVQTTAETTTGGRGWFGTVQVGCDYQFGGNWLVGAFGDYDFGQLKGNLNVPTFASSGSERMSSAWAVGGRVGWITSPNLLVYVSGGYTEAKFDRTNLTFAFAPFIGVPSGVYIGSNTYQGYFIGSGYEYALNWLPGLYWKTEYRFSDYGRETNPIRFTATGGLTGESIDSRKYTHMVRSELVYRFNWGGPVVAKY